MCRNSWARALLLACAAGLAGQAAADGVWRCPRDGVVLFQDRPCAGGQAIAVPPPVIVRAVPPLESAGTRATARVPAPLQAGAPVADADTVRAAVIRDRPVAGMSVARLRFALGQPQTVRLVESGRWRYEIWRWQRGGERITARIRDGRVLDARVERDRRPR